MTRTVIANSKLKIGHCKFAICNLQWPPHTRTWSLGVVFFLAFAAPAWARTIVLTDQDCEQMAAISADAPRMSWAATIYGTATEYSNHVIDLVPKQAFLIRYPLESIPKGQRITRAEWIVPYMQVSPAAGVRMQVRRLLKEWGPGVSHTYRMIRPQRAEWHTPGARGLGQDRAAKATATATAKGVGEQLFNVTEDVELWYTGAAPNYGWILTAEDQDVFVRLRSPFYGYPKSWKLRITFEPE
jgi:hypothetical protein